MGDDGAVGRSVHGADADQQRGMEPAAVLVAAFQVHVGRPAVAGALLQDAVRRTRLEPDIEDVACLFRIRGRRSAAQAVPAAMNSAASLLYQEFGPCRGEGLLHVFDGGGVAAAVRRMSLQKKAGRGTPQSRWREMHQSGRLAIMLAMRSSPQAGQPCHSAVMASRAFGAQAGVVHGDEPLLGGAEDDRLFAAPAMGIGVADGARRAAGCRFARRSSTMRSLAWNTGSPW